MKLNCWQVPYRFQTNEKYCRHSSVSRMPPVFRLLSEGKNRVFCVGPFLIILLFIYIYSAIERPEI
jgi:hypothetical protein